MHRKNAQFAENLAGRRASQLLCFRGLDSAAQCCCGTCWLSKQAYGQSRRNRISFAGAAASSLRCVCAASWDRFQTVVAARFTVGNGAESSRACPASTRQKCAAGLPLHARRDWLESRFDASFSGPAQRFVELDVRKCRGLHLFASSCGFLTIRENPLDIGAGNHSTHGVGVLLQRHAVRRPSAASSSDFLARAPKADGF